MDILQLPSCTFWSAFVADHLKTRNEKHAALIAFVSPTERQWRFSYVKEYATVEQDSGKVGYKLRMRHVVVPCAYSFPAESKSRPSAVAIRFPE